jgi:outer membrane protein OmpA-like peptidoglycan-associated protein/tetratricopeptide (TPR) repeat protein
MKKATSLLLLVIIFSSNIFSQKIIKSKLADRYYAKFAYIDAIPFYQDLASKDSNNLHFITRLCDCYRLTGDTKKAEDCYLKMDTLKNVDPINYYNYGLVLEENENYTEAKNNFKIYNEKNASDTRSNRKLNLKNINLYKDSSMYVIKNVNFNSSNADFGMSAIRDSSFIFTSNRPIEITEKHTYIRDKKPFLDLYQIEKLNSNRYSDPKRLPKMVNSEYHEGPICYDKVSNTYFVTRNNFNNGKYHKSRDGVNKLKIFILKFEGSKWGKFKEFEYNDDEYSVGHASISNDGKRLYFSSDMPGGYGLTDLYVCHLEGDKWGKPQNLGPEINTEGNEMFPFISNDDILYFSSDGNYGLGGLDIYSSKLNNHTYTEPINIGFPINSNKDDFSFYLSIDKTSGYFSSNRNNGKGSDDIYSFTIVAEHFFALGKAIDQSTGKPLPNTAVTLTDSNGTIISTTTTGEDGSYKFEVKQGENYTVTGSQNGYFNGKNNFSISQTDRKKETVVDVRLEKDKGLYVYGIIIDKITKTPLENVNVQINELKTGNPVINIRTPSTGDFIKSLPEKKLHDSLNYNIKIDKQGFLTKSVQYNKEITELSEIRLQEALDIEMDKIEVGTDIGKIIDIKPVYFDLSKWDIRKDAAIELDKIVKVMNENPTIEIELGSHTDCRSSAQKNMELSDKRAKASADYIKSSITNPERIYGKGYGESQLVNKCECEGAKKVPCTEEEHQQNRRTEFKIVKL